MIDFDQAAPNYRRAAECWQDAGTLNHHYEALRVVHARTAYGLVDHVKSFLECVCLTIINEYGAKAPSKPSMSEMLSVALQALGLRNSRGASKLDSVLSGFNKLAEAIADMRNHHGSVAHGKDGFIDVVAGDHARAFLHAGDAILSVLLNAREGKHPDLKSTRERYEAFERFNSQIDRAILLAAEVDTESEPPTYLLTFVPQDGYEPMEIRVELSRLLFGVDREAYVEALKSSTLERETEQQVPDSGIVQQIPSFAELRENDPVAVLSSGYVGRMRDLRPTLAEFLRSEGVDPDTSNATRATLVDSILATMDENVHVDQWKSATLQARLRIACRRVLADFGLNRGASALAGRLVWWVEIKGRHFGDVA
jgi:hypothetical protein